MMNLTELLCKVDDYCNENESKLKKQLIASEEKKRNRPTQLTMGEMMTIGKTSVGWFYRFKLHLVVNEKGDLINFCLTPGNVNDRSVVTKLVKNIIEKLFGDRGYISQELFAQLFSEGLQLITTIRKNMKNKFSPLLDKILLRKRYVIETINDQLKNISQIEHSRHRSVIKFFS